jgi:hypothetical protein
MSATLVSRLGRRGCLVLLLALPALSGCGNSTGTVSGKVTAKGQKVATGTVVFDAGGGRISTANITPEGTYTAVKVPVGLCKVAVLRPEERGPPPQRSAKVPGGGKLPPHPSEKSGGGPPPVSTSKPTRAGADKYRSPETSGLAFAVGPGNQTYDIPLD